MKFIFDLDDTVCETDKYSEEYILNWFKENNWNYVKVRDVSRYAEQKFNWDEETAMNWFKTYGDDMLVKITPKPNAVEIINKLFDMGHEIVFATARDKLWHGDPEGCTIKWLADNKIKYTKLYTGRHDKENICLEENPDFFIDDDINITGRVFEAMGGKTKVFIMQTPYNKDLERNQNVVMVDSFDDLLNKVNLK